MPNEVFIVWCDWDIGQKDYVFYERMDAIAWADGRLKEKSFGIESYNSFDKAGMIGLRSVKIG